MRKILLGIMVAVMCFWFVGCGDILEDSNNSEQEESQEQESVEQVDIDNSDILSKYKKLQKIDADYLHENTSLYIGKNVMSVANVGEVDGKKLKLKTKKTEDSLVFTYVCKFSDESELSGISEDDSICFAGKVNKTTPLTGTVEMSKCHIVATGKKVNKYKKQLKNKGKKVSKKNENENDNDKKSYIKTCQKYSYNSIKRNPDKYKGKRMYVSGKVVQLDEGWFDSVTLRLEDSSGNDWYVTYSYKKKEKKILEDDKITVYGECDGTEQYETIMGTTRRIPSVDAKYVK